MSLAEAQRKYRRDILRGMSRYLWVWAYMNWWFDDRPEGNEHSGTRQAVPSEEAYDTFETLGADDESRDEWDALTPTTPGAALNAAKDLEALIARAYHMPVSEALVQLFDVAMTVDSGEPHPLDPLAPAGTGREQLDVAFEFGEALAAMALDTGLSWFDRHRSAPGMDAQTLVPVRFEIHRDGDELVWSGSEDVPDPDATPNPGWKVQSLLFDRRDWTELRAKDWAQSHGYHYGQVDVTERKIRVRQREPVPGVPCRIKAFGKGIQAILCPVENPANCCTPNPPDAATARRLIQQHPRGRRGFYTPTGALSVAEVRRVANGDPALAQAIARELGART